MDTVQMRSRDFLIPGYPGTRISRRYPYFRPQLPITSHLLSIYYIQHAKICDGLTTFNALLSDRKQKQNAYCQFIFCKGFSYYLLFSTTYIITTKFKNASAKKQQEKEEKNRQQDSNFCYRMFTYQVQFLMDFFFFYYYRQWKNVHCKLEKQPKTKLLKRTSSKTPVLFLQINGDEKLITLNEYFYSMVSIKRSGLNFSTKSL